LNGRVDLGVIDSPNEGIVRIDVFESPVVAANYFVVLYYKSGDAVCYNTGFPEDKSLHDSIRKAIFGQEVNN